MSATARLLGWCVAIGLTLTVSSVLAGPDTMAGSTHVCWIALGQSDQSDSAESRGVADKWLRQARDAMKSGDLNLAEYYIERAEKLNVKYDPLFARFKDTPAKVRKDLEAKRAEAGRGATGSTGALSRLFNKDKDNGETRPPSDPYGGQAASGAPAGMPNTQGPGSFPSASRPAMNGMTRQPGAQATAGGLPPSAVGPRGSAFPMGSAPDQDRQRHSDELLASARAALAKGDAQRAALFTGQAKRLGLVYPLNADSPDKVEALIQQAMIFAKGPGPQEDAAAYTRNFAQFLLDQATGLLGYRAFDEAQQLAQQAKDLQAQFGQFDRTPDQVLTQIAAVRRQTSGLESGNAELGSRMSLSDGAGGSPRRLPPPGDAATGSKAEALRLVAQARAALDRGDLLAAKQMAERAQSLAPESAYGANETRPWMVLLEVNKAMNRRGGAVVPAGNFESQNAVATDDQRGGAYPVSQGIYDPANDASRNMAAQALQPTPAQPPVSDPVTPPAATPGDRLYQEGLRALENHDRATALKLFRDAWKYEKELDPQTRQQLQDKLILLQANVAPPANVDGTQPTPLEAVDSKQQLLRQKLYREITTEQAASQQMSVTDPRGALERLKKLRDRVNDSEVDPSSKKQLLTLVDRSVDSLEQFIETNRTEIELAEHNREVREGVVLDGQRKQEIQNKLASLVEEFNQLLEEQRYAEAERIAKQARELDPEAEVVQNLMWQSRFIRRIQEQMSIDEKKEQGFYDAISAVNDSAAPHDDRQPYMFGDPKQWKNMSTSRGARLDQERHRLTKAELEIQKAMSNQVDVKFTDRPLSEVMDLLSELSGVPIVLDPVGMAAEGVTSETPVTIRLNQQISLRSALNLILAPLRLSHVIQDEVLRVTSEQTRDSNTYHKVYNVADLVIPIPNFIPGYNTGLAGCHPIRALDVGLWQQHDAARPRADDGGVQ